MKRNHTFRLLVHGDLQHAASREMLGGILRFAAVHPQWEVQIDGGHPSNEPIDKFLDWKPDALITNTVANTFSHADFTTLAGRAVVFVNTRPRRDVTVPYATLTSDDRAMALAACELFLRKRLSSFAYVGSPGQEKWDEARRRFFRAALKDRGHGLFTFDHLKGQSWRESENAMIRWLKMLPKPCGIWAAYDQRGKHVLDACRLADIAVPEQVQVLGVDDETYICEQTLPSLSSISPNFEAAGFAAAAFLDNAVRNKADGRRPHAIKIGIRGVIERLSTFDTAGVGRRVSVAKEFIRQHFASGIGLSDIAAALGISTRLLEKNYRAVTGHTVLEDIQALRLEKVCRLLRTTTTPIDSIGPFCGFASTSHLKALFKRTYGMTMSRYRCQG